MVACSRRPYCDGIRTVAATDEPVLNDDKRTHQIFSGRQAQCLQRQRWTNLLQWLAIEQTEGDVGACDRADEKGRGIAIEKRDMGAGKVRV